MKPYIEIFSKQIPIYGVMFFVGIFVAAAVAALVCKKRELPGYEIAYSGVYTMIGAMIGAKLLFIIVSWKDIVKYDIPFENILKGGFVFYGGLIGGFLGLLTYSLIYKMKLNKFLDIYAAVLPLGHAFGRVGCFFAGCCYGMEYDGPFCYTYTATAGVTPLGVPLFPIQLLEALCLLLIFGGLMVVLHKTKKVGVVYKCYLVAYAIVRFALEYLRGDGERGKFLFLSTSQWVSVGIILLCVAIILYNKYFKRPENDPPTEEKNEEVAA